MTPALAAAYSVLLEKMLDTIDAVDRATAAALTDVGAPQSPPHPSVPASPDKGTDPQRVRRHKEELGGAVDWLRRPRQSDGSPDRPDRSCTRGGSILAPDVNAFDVANGDNDSYVTVNRHSYGSTTVTDAAAGFGMHTDDTVLVGSPGTDMARSAADLHLLDGGHVQKTSRQRRRTLSRTSAVSRFRSHPCFGGL